MVHDHLLKVPVNIKKCFPAERCLAFPATARLFQLRELGSSIYVSAVLLVWGLNVYSYMTYTPICRRFFLKGVKIRCSVGQVFRRQSFFVLSFWKRQGVEFDYINLYECRYQRRNVYWATKYRPCIEVRMLIDRAACSGWSVLEGVTSKLLLAAVQGKLIKS